MCKKEYGTFILKPDIFESGNLEDLSAILRKYNLPVKGTFLIDDYHSFSLDYRKYDLNIRYADDEKEYERNFKRNMVAINAYQMEYKGAANKGIAMFVQNMFDDNEIFYEQMAKVKTELRETIEKRRGYVTFLYMGQDPWFTFKDKRERLSQLRTHENKTVDIAFINSIHLEDKDLFERDACSKFIFESGIMNRENIVYLEQLKENYLIKMPQINEREV